MINSKAIKRFESSTLDEKREIITLYFNAYKQAKDKKYIPSLRNIDSANGLWGNVDLTNDFEELLNGYHLIKFEEQIEKVLESLISAFSPSKNM